MQIFRTLEDLPTTFGATIASVGNFDGVHRAHQLVLKQIVERARELRLKAIAVTFHPHPVRVLRPSAAPRLITPLEQKLALLQQTGIDAVLVLPFTEEFSQISSHDFAKSILCEKLRAREVHEGANFRFGHGAAGHVQQLAALGEELGFAVKIYPELKMRGELVSSSRIRALIAAGHISRARVLLGRAYSVVSHPAKGRGIGARHTVPTINLSEYSEVLPANGVYITRMRIGEECFDSVSNLGLRPTFGGNSFAVETHIFDFHPLELTPETRLELFFLKRLRDERKFPSAAALKEQIDRDAARAQRFFALSRKFAPSAKF